jgi:hypothetical protein
MEHLSRGRRERRYGRAARILLDDENISDEQLANKLADMDEATASYCRLAFNEIKQVMIENGWRKA